MLVSPLSVSEVKRDADGALTNGSESEKQRRSQAEKKPRRLIYGFLFSGFRRWGRLAIRGPFRCKHRIKLRKPRPGHQGPRVGASLPGHDLAGNQIACRLVGDELAHDLDSETLQRLESLLADYLGTMLLVSRDRARLNDVAASTLVIEDDGLVKEQQASHDGDLRQRPAEPACQSGPDPDDPGSKAADVSREQSRKLSVNERLEPNSMPGRIEQLEKSARDRHAALAGRSFHRQGRAEIAGGKIRLGGLERDLAAASRAGMSWKVASGEWRVASELWPLPACTGTSWKSAPVDSACSLTWQGSLCDRSGDSAALP